MVLLPLLSYREDPFFFIAFIRAEVRVAMAWLLK